jgi:uncharacterized protein
VKAIGIAAARPPRVFLTAEWRSLLMLNYAIDPAALAPFLPRGTELDLWQGGAIVSMVGFLFLKTRLRGWAVPLHQNFEEVNLRFYVRRRVAEGWKRGVVFVKEIVPRPAIAVIARLLYNEKYEARRMRHCVALDLPDRSGTVEYQWRSGGRWQVLGAIIRGEPETIAADSEAEFIFEHYWGYSRQRDGGTVEYEVRHPRWRAWKAEETRFDCDVARIYGGRFVEALSTAPQSAFVAEGSAVEVLGGVRFA